jgi:hypothetical protein
MMKAAGELGAESHLRLPDIPSRLPNEDLRLLSV